MVPNQIILDPLNRSVGMYSEKVVDDIIGAAMQKTADTHERIKLIYGEFERVILESATRKDKLEKQIHDYDAVSLELSLYHAIWNGFPLETFAANPTVQTQLLLKIHGKKVLEFLTIEQNRLAELFRDWKHTCSGHLDKLGLK